ncbi:hypothetical protein [Streptomyces sp. CT34]|uniref:hypothetical protein n=1 Tax=Streptomyces sp. CT34 TaxID=1553907 RepID=UPI000A9C19D7|nr:hypothetical protein [Streptomyces sp. CT34]
MMATSTDRYPYAFHIALDGNGLNGLEGAAGVCVFRYNPDSGEYAYRVEYYDGVAGGHALSITPDRKSGFLGNSGQQLLFYDVHSLEERERVSALRFETPDASIKSSTHMVWLDNTQGVTAIGDGFWLVDLDHPTKAERIGDHLLKLPHAMKRTASGRYLVYGGMDHPSQGEAAEVGIFDLEKRLARRIPLPTTCWHVACHPHDDVFYALSFRVHPQDGRDWHEWAMAYFKEYVYEIDAGSGQILRHWACGQNVPAHINSDVCISDRELIYCNGGSGTIVMIDLADFTSYRVIDERPRLSTQMRSARQAARQVTDAFTRGSLIPSSRHFVGALRVTRGTLIDSVYACQLSADQKLLFTANRGLNTITVYDYPANAVRLRVEMPELRAYLPDLPVWTDPRLGFHHSTLLSPVPAPAGAPLEECS